MSDTKLKVKGLILPEEERQITRWWTIQEADKEAGRPASRIKIPYVDDECLDSIIKRSMDKTQGRHGTVKRLNDEKRKNIILTELQLEWEEIYMPENPPRLVTSPTDEEKIYIGRKMPGFAEQLLVACMQWEEFARSLEDDRKN